MIILAQNDEAMYDTEKSVGICAKDTTVYMLSYTGELAYILGNYNSGERAKEVVADIFVHEGCQDKYEMPVI